jgi:hypothetical protein
MEAHGTVVALDGFAVEFATGIAADVGISDPEPSAVIDADSVAPHCSFILVGMSVDIVATEVDIRGVRMLVRRFSGPPWWLSGFSRASKQEVGNYAGQIPGTGGRGSASPAVALAVGGNGRR